MGSSDPQPPVQPRVVRLRLRRRARHARLVLGRAGLAGVAAASLVAVPAITRDHGQGGLTQESVVLAAPAGAPWPGAGQGTGMFLPVADPGVRADQPGAGTTVSGPDGAGSDAAGLGAAVPPELLGGSALSRGIPSLVLDAYRRAADSLQGSDPGCGLPWWLLAGIGRIESGQGLRWPGRPSRHDPGDDPRPPAGRVGGRDGGHPRHRRRGAGPRPDLRPGRRPDAVPPGHLAPVRRRRQRRRASPTRTTCMTPRSRPDATCAPPAATCARPPGSPRRS